MWALKGTRPFTQNLHKLHTLVKAVILVHLIQTMCSVTLNNSVVPHLTTQRVLQMIPTKSLTACKSSLKKAS